GLDADKLDNQEGSYYRNASNLNAGTVSRARLGALWCYNNTDETEYPYIQTGSQGIYSPVAGANTFSNAFTSSVIVVATAKDNGEFCSVISVTTTGFTIRHPDDTGFAYWIATGKKT
nr:hypothetical protein [Candidatus Aminicenantes bacterium]NIM84043.1 hypothetical protein [Candidatus Aminicenantes bacterium]NIN23507.1 hypothetical protein [Candidatus Aminicenantes bacterium]NIN47212.1 hypothetical protein [Candidatus Aminicenantes bacterium]NIN90138.1 hypothetical protein [Candidatus Aminicenantes bacterium]